MSYTSIRVASIADLRSEIDALKAELAKAESEAEMYRWLRDVSEPGICAFFLAVGKAFEGVKFKPETVDAAIRDQIEAFRNREGR